MENNGIFDRNSKSNEMFCALDGYFAIGFNRVYLLVFSKIDNLRDEFFTERKERERLQSQKDKMKREHEAAQSRIASLQEQVIDAFMK